MRCVHLLEAPSQEVDCSYSRPDLPFSVFLSVPGYGTHARIERVTEALVHETMHIQLSLLERRLLLVESDRPENASPSHRGGTVKGTCRAFSMRCMSS